MLARMKQRIAEFRNRKGWTQEQLAERVGLSTAVIRKYERGGGGLAALGKIEKLAEALGIHPLALLSEEAERLLNVKARGYDEMTMAEALTIALETSQQRNLPLSPEQLAKMALMFYESRFGIPNENN